MDDSAALHELDDLKDLKHYEGYLSFNHIMSSDVFKKLAAVDLLHNDIQVVFGFICLFHLNNVWVRYKSHNLYFFPKVVSVSGLKDLLVDHFHSDYLICLLALALIYIGVLATPESPAAAVKVIKIEIASLLFQMLDPLKYHILIVVIKKATLVVF